MVTPGNRTRNLPHRRPRTDWLTVEWSRPKIWLEQVNLRTLIVYTPLDYYRLEACAGWAWSIVYSYRENFQMRFAMKSLKRFSDFLNWQFWGCTRKQLATILDKKDGKFVPPHPPKSRMEKWRVLAFALFHPWFGWGGGGWGFAVPFYSVQECRCCVEVHCRTVLGGKFGPSFLSNLVIANGQ